MADNSDGAPSAPPRAKSRPDNLAAYKLSSRVQNPVYMPTFNALGFSTASEATDTRASHESTRGTQPAPVSGSHVNQTLASTSTKTALDLPTQSNTLLVESPSEGFEMSTTYSSFRSKVDKRRKDLGIFLPTATESTTYSERLDQVGGGTCEQPSITVLESNVSVAGSSVYSQKSNTTDSGDGNLSTISENNSKAKTTTDAENSLPNTIEPIPVPQQESTQRNLGTTEQGGMPSHEIHQGATRKRSSSPPIVLKLDDDLFTYLYTRPSTPPKPSMAQAQASNVDYSTLNTDLKSTVTSTTSINPTNLVLNKSAINVDYPVPTEQAVAAPLILSRIKDFQERLQSQEQPGTIKSKEAKPAPGRIEPTIRERLLTPVNREEDVLLPLSTPPKRGPIPKAARASFVERSKAAGGTPTLRSSESNRDYEITPQSSYVIRARQNSNGMVEGENGKNQTKWGSSISGSKQGKGKSNSTRSGGSTPFTRSLSGRVDRSPISTETSQSFGSLPTLNEEVELDNLPSNQSTPRINLPYTRNRNPHGQYSPPNTGRGSANATRAAESSADSGSKYPNLWALPESDQYFPPEHSSSSTYSLATLQQNNEEMIVILAQHCRNRLSHYSTPYTQHDDDGASTPRTSHPRNGPNYTQYQNESAQMKLQFLDEMRRALGCVRDMCDEQLNLLKKMEREYLVGSEVRGTIAPGMLIEGRSGSGHHASHPGSRNPMSMAGKGYDSDGGSTSDGETRTADRSFYNSRSASPSVNFPDNISSEVGEENVE